MIGNEDFIQNRLITPKELALYIIMQRNTRGWTQEVLAELAQTTVRTIQRVEKGEISSVQTRHALARALEIDDIDFFNKPLPFPDVEKIKEASERLNKETTLVSLKKVQNGKMMREVLEAGNALSFDSVIELSQAMEECFANMQDYFRDYLDIYSEYSAIDKLQVNKDFELLLDEFSKNECSIGVATRSVVLNNNEDYKSTPFALSLNHFVICSSNNFPEKVRVRKQTDFVI